jgi:hypothetical protein
MPPTRSLVLPCLCCSWPQPAPFLSCSVQSSTPFDSAEALAHRLLCMDNTAATSHSRLNHRAPRMHTNAVGQHVSTEAKEMQRQPSSRMSVPPSRSFFFFLPSTFLLGGHWASAGGKERAERGATSCTDVTAAPLLRRPLTRIAYIRVLLFFVVAAPSSPSASPPPATFSLSLLQLLRSIHSGPSPACELLTRRCCLPRNGTQSTYSRTAKQQPCRSAA